MPVETPQIDVPVYKQAEEAKTPIPQFAPSQPLPAQAGYAGRGGQIAKVASDVLNGWMQGLQFKQEKQIRQASTEVAGAKTAVKTLGDNYQQTLLQNGGNTNSPEAKAAFDAWTKAYHANLDIQEKYAIPDKKPKGSKKEGVKNAVEGSFAGIMGKHLNPQMFPEMAIAAMRATPPKEGLSQDSLESQKRSKLEDVQMKAAENELATSTMSLQEKTDAKKTQDRWKELSGIPIDKQTPSQKQELALTEKVMLGPQTPDKQILYGAVSKIQNGEKLNDMERSLAYKSGLLESPQVIQRIDGGKDVLQTISSDGKVLSTTTLGKHYEKDEAAAAVRMLYAQQNAQFQLYKKAQPGTPDEDIWKLVAADQTRSPYMQSTILGSSPMQTEENANTLSKAIRRVMGESGKGDEGAEHKAQWSNFIVEPSQNDATGRYMFRTQVAPPTGSTGFFNKKSTYAGGLDADSLKTSAEAFRNRLKAALKDENPKMSDAQIESLIPPILQSPASPASGPQAMSAPPNTTPGSWARPGSNAPQVMGQQAPGAKLYTVTGQDGTAQAWLTESQVQSVKAQGGQVASAQ